MSQQEENHYEKLIAAKAKVEKAQTKVSELKGQETALLERLQNEFKCKTVKEAEDLVTKLDAAIGKMEKEIKTSMETLEANYPTLFEDTI